MKRISEFEILDAINRHSSVVSLLRAGYAYLEVFKLLGKLENDREIERREDGRIVLTESGKMLLEFLKPKVKKTNRKMMVLPLYRARTTKIKLHEIYLPSYNYFTFVIFRLSTGVRD